MRTTIGGSGARQAHGLAKVTLVCLVLVSAYSAVFEADAWLWFTWAALALITGVLFATRR